MANEDSQLHSYYPSARVRLVMRFEEYSAKDTPAVPAKKPQTRTGEKDPGPKLRAERSPQNGAFVLLGPGDDPGSVGSPQQQRTSTDGRTQVVDGIIPTSATLNRNGIRQADTLTLEVEYLDLPIDARAVRSCAVEYYLGTVTADDFQRGVAGETRTDATPSGIELPLNVVPDEWVDDRGQVRSNRRFQGWVDEWTVEWPDGEAPVVRLECTDNTMLLLDQDAPPRLTVGTEAPIDQAIAEYLSNFPQFRGLEVMYLPGWAVRAGEVPTLKQSLAATAFQPKLGPSPATGGTSKLKVWDYLTDVVGSIGHILRFDGVRAIVQTARTLYGNQFTGREDDPHFTAQRFFNGQRLTRRLMLYGHNISEMGSAKRFVRWAPTNIEVRCTSTRRKKTSVVRFPSPGDRNKRLNPGDSADQKWEVVRVTGIEDEKTLRLVAQTYFERFGRNEMEMRVSTKNLASFGDGNADPDLLDFQVGDDLDVQILRDPDAANTVVQLEDRAESDAARLLTEVGYPAEFATAYFQVIANVGFPTVFRGKEATIDWQKDEGVVVEIVGINYVEVRVNAELPEGEEQVQRSVGGTGPSPPVVVEDDPADDGVIPISGVVE